MTRVKPTEKLVMPSFFQHIEFIRNQLNKKNFHIPYRFPPQTTNCVYLIFCTKCNKQYVGETSNTLNQRMWQHKYNILHHKELHTPLVKHFIEHNWLSLKIMILEHNEKLDRKGKEKDRKEMDLFIEF